jgi:hypothetical protein
VQNKKHFIDLKTAIQKVMNTKTQNLYFTFLSSAQFYSNPVRSFLQYLKNCSDSSCEFTNFPENLYTASENLTDEHKPISFSLQLADGFQYPVVMTTQTVSNNSVMTLDFGSATFAEHLLAEGEFASAILVTGARMTRADCAFVSLETEFGDTCEVKMEFGRLHINKLPLILWTTMPLSEESLIITSGAQKRADREDGAFLVVSPVLLKKNRILWLDSRKNRYFLIPDRETIEQGDLTIFNLEGEEKQVKTDAIAFWEISAEEAQSHLNNEIQQSLDNTKRFASHFIEFSLEESIELNQPRTNLSNAIAILLGFTPEELQNHPEFVKTGMLNFLMTLKEVIYHSLSGNESQLNSAREQMRNLQTRLREHGVDLGENLVQLPNRLQALQLTESTSPSSPSYTAKLRQFADQIERFTIEQEQDFESAALTFVKGYQELFGKPNETQKKEKLQQEYRQMADKAIAQSLSDFQMPSFDFQDLLPKT